MVVTELKFCRVSVQVFLRAVLVDSFHASLENGKIAFDRVGMDRAAAPLASRMAYKGMVAKEKAPRTGPGNRRGIAGLRDTSRPPRARQPRPRCSG